jgi:hypothetical protein
LAERLPHGAGASESRHQSPSISLFGGAEILGMCRLYLAVIPIAVLACVLTGCNMKKEPAAIDHKDEPGEYRDRVRESVEQRVGMKGQSVTSRDELVGSWDVAGDTSLGKSPPEPMFRYHLSADGSCVIETTAGGRTLRDTGKWRLNADGTFTLLIDCAPDPSTPGLEHGAVDESRYFLLGLPDGRCVLWNGDGSLFLVLSGRRSR